MTDALGRFGHHPDPAIDFCVEVDAIAGDVFEAKRGIIEGDPVTARIRRAMQFRVGGDEGAVAAKAVLREIENQFSPYP